MKSIFILVSLLLASGFVAASESSEKNIECTIYNETKELGTVQLDDSAKSVSFVGFKIDDKQKVDLACGITNGFVVLCNAYLYEGKDVLMASAPNIVKFGNGKVSIVCSSVLAMMEWNQRHPKNKDLPSKPIGKNQSAVDELKLN